MSTAEKLYSDAQSKTATEPVDAEATPEPQTLEPAKHAEVPTQAEAKPEEPKPATAESSKDEPKPASPAVEGAEKKEKTPEAKPSSAPEKYDLKLPEGSHLHESSVTNFIPVAKELGLSNDQAQAVLNRESQLRSSFIEESKAELEKKADAWVEEIRADREIGGAEFERTAELSKRFVDRFFTDAFRKTLNETRLGNHPELVRGFARAAKLISEDSMVVPGAQAAHGRKSAAEVLYGGSEAAKE